MSAPDNCTDCDGSGTESFPAVFVDNACVEPPVDDQQCGSCCGTGMRHVQEMYAELLDLRAQVKQQAEVMREQGAELRVAEEEAYGAWCAAQDGGWS